MASDLLLALGQRVRALRRGCGWTQAQLGDAIGLSRTSVTNIEAGRQGDIPVTVLARLAAALGVRVGDLLDGAPARLPWLELARRVTEAEREHRRDAAVAWQDHDYLTAIRRRGIADGLALARELHLDVVGGGSDAPRVEPERRAG